MQIVYTVMIPYFVYMFSVLYYFTYYITGVHTQSEPGFFNGSTEDNILRAVILLMTLMFVGIELA
jgi:hypothetical protein